MKRLLAIAAVQLAGGLLFAQRITSTRISAEPCGKFVVDGTTYTKSATFLWPENSKHTLSTVPVYDISNVVRCTVAGGWHSSAGADLPANTVISAGAEGVSYDATAAFAYLIRLAAGDGQTPPLHCPETGVYFNDACYDRNTLIWVGYGTAGLRATAPDGWVFSDWEGQVWGTSAAMTITIDRPLLIIARFGLAARMTFLTNPPELKLLVDRTLVTTPIAYDWGFGTTHALAPLSPQRDSTGAPWVFESWSHGGAEIQDYTVATMPSIVTVTANFAPGVSVGFRTDPLGLKLVVDGRENWRTYNFLWAQGSKHTVAAPLEQLDAAGRKYIFREWSTGAPVEHEVTAEPGAGAIARYDALGKLVVQTSHPEAVVLVDGEPCPSPCTVHRVGGGSAKILPPATVPQAEGTRLELDGEAGERTWTAGGDAETMMFRYVTAHQLRTSSDPAGGTGFALQPPSADGFYREGTEVSVTAEVKQGYKFRYWEGDLDGIARSGVVAMSRPAAVRAVLERVPYIAPAGVRNAAGEREDPAVAPGSIIAIYGGGLAPDYERGPDSPLAQLIGGITVQAEDRVLPLFFVSPEQINALLPSDFPEGEHTLTVRGDSQPDITAKFTVRRNAPGLFGRSVETRLYAVASHPDGSMVTIDSPARQGEEITLLGTGLGPYIEGALDGFIVPAGVEFRLADPVEIKIGDQTIEPLYAGVAAGYAGMQAIRFRIGEGVPAAASLEVKVSTNGQESNMVLLPLK